MKLRLPLILCVLLGASSCSSIQEFAAPHPDADPDMHLRDSLREIQQHWTWEQTGVLSLPTDVRERIQSLAVAFPRHPEIQFVNSLVSYQMGEAERAQAYLDNIFIVKPSHPEAAVLRSRIAMEEGNLPFALRFLEQQIRLAPGSAELREGYAAALFLTERYADSEEALRAAKELGAPGWRIAYHRGLIAESRGSVNEAFRYYSESLLAHPGFEAAADRLQGLKALDGRQ